jgi:hypothetical protein
VLKNTVPLEFSVPVPRVVDPSKNVIVPAGTVLPDCGATVAVKTRFSPESICVAEAVNVVVVATTVCVTVTTTTADEELASVVLPP